MVDLESGKLEVELHIRTATDLANNMPEIHLMTCTRLTIGQSICQSVRSCTNCLSANQISEFCAYLYRCIIIVNLHARLKHFGGHLGEAHLLDSFFGNGKSCENHQKVVARVIAVGNPIDY